MRFYRALQYLKLKFRTYLASDGKNDDFTDNAASSLDALFPVPYWLWPVMACVQEMFPLLYCLWLATKYGGIHCFHSVLVIACYGICTVNMWIRSKYGVKHCVHSSGHLPCADDSQQIYWNALSGSSCFTGSVLNGPCQKANQSILKVPLYKPFACPL